MKTEKEFSKLAQAIFDEQFLVKSFESSLNKSTPDLYLVERRGGYSVWVELKIEEGGKVSFMSGQCQWLEEHAKSGGLCYVLVLHESGIVRLYESKDARWLSTTKHAHEKGQARCLQSTNLGYTHGWKAITHSILSDCQDKWVRG